MEASKRKLEALETAALVLQRALDLKRAGQDADGELLIYDALELLRAAVSKNGERRPSRFTVFTGGLKG